CANAARVGERRWRCRRAGYRAARRAGLPPYPRAALEDVDKFMGEERCTARGWRCVAVAAEEDKVAMVNASAARSRAHRAADGPIAHGDGLGGRRRVGVHRDLAEFLSSRAFPPATSALGWGWSGAV